MLCYFMYDVIQVINIHEIKGYTQLSSTLNIYMATLVG